MGPVGGNFRSLLFKDWKAGSCSSKQIQCYIKTAGRWAVWNGPKMCNSNQSSTKRGTLIIRVERSKNMLGK